MKILVVCQYYKPEPFRIADICEELVRRGHEVTVVTGVPNYPEGDIYPGYQKSWGKTVEDNGVKVRRCYTIPRKTGAFYRILNYFSFALSSTRYLSGLKEDYDVVFVNQLSPVMMAEGAIRYARKHGKRTLLYCLDLWPESLTAGGIAAGSPIYRVFKGISRRIYRSVDRILITSKGFGPYLNALTQEDTEYGYLPQYAESFFGDVPRWTPHDGQYHFVFAGNIGEMQSVDTLIDAARLLREDARVVFDIVGEGSALAQCKKRAEGLTNVVFHGRRSVEQMPEFYAMADAMLISMKDNPGIANTLPGKVQSYMAAGRAVLGSIGGETAAVVADARCGVCVPPENAAALAEQIRELLARPEKFGEYGENARAYSGKYFRKDVFMDKLLSELEECSTNQ